VAAVKADPDMAVRLGRRAIGRLIEKLRDPDRVVRGAAANALTQLGDRRAIQRLVDAVNEE
jgi:HEAT repeat protein